MSAMLQTRPAPTGSARRDPAIGMWVVLVGQLMLVLDATIVNVALPHIATDLHFGSASLSWVLNAYSLAFGGLLLLGGRLGDVLGRRRVFMTGLGLFTLASFAGGFAQTHSLGMNSSTRTVTRPPATGPWQHSPSSPPEEQHSA